MYDNFERLEKAIGTQELLNAIIKQASYEELAEIWEFLSRVYIDDLENLED